MSELLSDDALVALGVVSGVVLVGSAIGIPAFLVGIQSDYFQRSGTTPRSFVEWCAKVAKNILGLVLVLAGIAMLPLPGPGSLLFLVGLSLLDFPGRRRLIDAIVLHPRVAPSIDRLRARFGRPPLFGRQPVRQAPRPVR